MRTTTTLKLKHIYKCMMIMINRLKRYRCLRFMFSDYIALRRYVGIVVRTVLCNRPLFWRTNQKWKVAYNIKFRTNGVRCGEWQLLSEVGGWEKEILLKFSRNFPQIQSPARVLSETYLVPASPRRHRQEKLMMEFFRKAEKQLRLC